MAVHNFTCAGDQDWRAKPVRANAIDNAPDMFRRDGAELTLCWLDLIRSPRLQLEVRQQVVSGAGPVYVAGYKPTIPALPLVGAAIRRIGAP